MQRRLSVVLSIAVLMGHSSCIVSGFTPNALPRTKVSQSWSTQSPASVSFSSSMKTSRLSMSSEAKDPNEGPSSEDNDNVATMLKYQ